MFVGVNNRVKCYSYYKNISNCDIYTCNKCSIIKKSKTCMINYGVDNPSKSKDIKERKKETTMKNHGVEYPLQSKVIISNLRSYFSDKYGVDWITKDINLSKIRKNTNLEKYGYESVLSSPDIHSKIKETCLYRYGVSYVSQCEWFKDTVRNNRVSKGNQIPTKLKTLYERYKSIVRSNTKRSIFDDWDGIDYYDNEYIKDNMLLHPNDRLYPTIDHKVSIYYGFMNNIPESEIYDTKNLCITKRHINSSKNKKCYYENI